jgi:serine/threonine-protein kinase
MSALPRLPEPGQIVASKYLVRHRLGDGGMASVFEAQHQRLGIPVALKFLHPRLTRFPALVERFLQEARMVARIRSPHVVQVLDVEQDAQGLPFLVLELLRGATLRAWEDAAPERRLAPAEALRFAVQLCEGLEAVHRAGIVHRDLKPDNLMISASAAGAPTLSLLDFGIAMPEPAPGQGRGSLEGAVLGTPEYMAPEQLCAADSVDLRADLFSAGALIYEMLAGRLPAAGEGAQAIADRHREGRIPRLSLLVPAIEAGLAEVVHRAMSPRPDDRFASAAELRAAIEPWIPASSAAASATPPPVSVGAALPTASPDAGDALPTTVEAPWFTVEPGVEAAPLSVPLAAIAAPSSSRVAAPPVSLPLVASPPSARRRRAPLAALGAVLLASALGASILVLAPMTRSKGPARSDLVEAMLAAPSTEVEADPPAPPAEPEVTPAAPSSRSLRAPVAVAGPAPRPPVTVPASLPPPPPPVVLEAPRRAPPIAAPACHGAPPAPVRAASREPAQAPPREARREPPRRVEPARPPPPPELVFATPPPPRPMLPIEPPPRRRQLRFVPLVTIIH